MDAVETESPEELVRRYKVCFEVSPELGPVDAGVRPIGFTIELSGTHGHEPGAPLADCDECARGAEALRRIAEAALPSEQRDVSLAVQSPRARYSLTPKHGNRPDLRATISVLHQGPVQRPVDASEARGRDDVVAKLRALGVPEGDWHE